MNTTLMHKDILRNRASFGRRDEAVALFVAKPLDTSLNLCHGKRLKSCRQGLDVEVGALEVERSKGLENQAIKLDVKEGQL